MIGLRERTDVETDGEAGFRREFERVCEPVVGQFPAHQGRRERAVHTLLPVDLCVRTGWVERELGLDDGGAEQPLHDRREMVGTGGVGTRRPPHDGAEDVVQDADAADARPCSHESLHADLPAAPPRPYRAAGSAGGAAA